MSKNQGGIVQYVNFHKKVDIKIIPEKKSRQEPKKISIKALTKNENLPINKEVKTAKIAKFPKSNKNETATINEIKAVVFKKTTTKKTTTKVEKKTTNIIKINPIKAFFEQNKAFYDIHAILSNDKASKITIFKDITNEQIHKKAINSIIKAMKSTRKFKMEENSKAS